MGTRNSIFLKRYTPVRVEAVAAAAIKPGQFVELDANGAFILATAKAKIQRTLATEDELQGNSITDTYAIGDLVTAYILVPGDEVQVLAEGAAAAAIVIGDDLAVAAGNVVESAAANAAYTALEALTIASGGADALVAVRVDG